MSNIFEDDTNSQLSTEISLDVIRIVRDELSKFGCDLKDYHIDFNVEGFNISDVKLSCPNPSIIIDVLKTTEPEVRHEYFNAPTKYAFKAANIEIAKRINDELGLDYKGFEYKNSDKISMSVREPEVEKPLPQEELPPAIINSVEEPIEPETGEDLGIEEPIELPPELSQMTPEEELMTDEDVQEAEPSSEDLAEIERIKEAEKGRPGREY